MKNIMITICFLLLSAHSASYGQQQPDRTAAKEEVYIHFHQGKGIEKQKPGKKAKILDSRVLAVLQKYKVSDEQIDTAYPNFKESDTTVNTRYGYSFRQPNKTNIIVVKFATIEIAEKAIKELIKLTIIESIYPRVPRGLVLPFE